MFSETAPHNPDWTSISYVAQDGFTAGVYPSPPTLLILALFGPQNILIEYNHGEITLNNIIHAFTTKPCINARRRKCLRGASGGRVTRPQVGNEPHENRGAEPV